MVELVIGFQASTQVELGRAGGPCTELLAGKFPLQVLRASYRAVLLQAAQPNLDTT